MQNQNNGSIFDATGLIPFDKIYIPGFSRYVVSSTVILLERHLSQFKFALIIEFVI